MDLLWVGERELQKSHLRPLHQCIIAMQFIAIMHWWCSYSLRLYLAPQKARVDTVFTLKFKSLRQYQEYKKIQLIISPAS
jgi:hypothetical protein